MMNPFKQHVSQSLSKMPREALSLNRRPEIFANHSYYPKGAQRSDTSSLFKHERSLSSPRESPVDLGPAMRKSQLMQGRSASHNQLNRNSEVRISRKKETIDNFKSKLSRLEKNKVDLENKMKLFDAKVKAHTMTKSASDTL